MNAVFLINRLRGMSIPELLFRVRNKVVSCCEKVCCRHMRFDSAIIGDETVLVDIGGIDDIGAKADSIIQDADKLCGNIFSIFALRDIRLDEPLNYHRDYKNSREAPSHLFGKDIDYRDSSVNGDIKYIWEINRHLFLLKLAIAFKATGDTKYLDKFIGLLSAWFEQNRFMMGVNWTSPLESAIRLINWTFCWQILKDDLPEGLRLRWMDSVHRHCWFIYGNFSRYSSANNHLIGEAAGLLIATVGFPRFKRSRRWMDRARRILAAECVIQTHEDGVNKEQAVCYQQFVLDFLLFAGVAGEKAEIGFDWDYWETVGKMLRYIAAIRDSEGNVPQFGDEDDGMVIDLGQGVHGNYDSLLRTGALLLDTIGLGDPYDGMHDFKTEFMMNMSGKAIRITGPDLQGLPPACFTKGGYYILGDADQKLIFDCGPLGYLSLAAHGHADALSFFFSAYGCPVFVDPGTYAYHSDRQWRDYFRGTSAHNTVCIDDTDQSEITGAFMWGKKAGCTVELSDAPLCIKASHDGYRSLKNGAAIHSREIRYSPEGGMWEITDFIDCRGEHSVSLHFHLHPDSTASIEEGHVLVGFAKGFCRLNYDQGMDVCLVKGSTYPFLGWYSGSFDIKEPCFTVKMTKRISSPASIRTSFKAEAY